MWEYAELSDTDLNFKSVLKVALNFELLTSHCFLSMSFGGVFVVI
jgi:hypothetical protein